MFGLSFGEFVVLLLVAVVVLGPKEMPRYLRKAGEMAGKLRRMAYEMRAKSGIDEVLRSEGIGADIAEIRRLASFARGELGGIVSSVRSAANGAALNDVATSAYPPGTLATPPASIGVPPPAVIVDRQREYPVGGPDSYGALPETSAVYEGDLPTSPLAADPLYSRGEPRPDDGPTVDDAKRAAGAPS